MKDIISRNVFSIIENNLVLAQTFVVVLFFECFHIYFNKESLFSQNINLEDISLKPFFGLIYFIVVIKMIWLFILMLKLMFHSKFYKYSFEINSKTSFTSFLLFWLCIGYCYLIGINPKLVPFYNENNSLLNNLYLFPFIITIFSTFAISAFGFVVFDNSNTEKKRV